MDRGLSSPGFLYFNIHGCTVYLLHTYLPHLDRSLLPRHPALTCTNERTELNWKRNKARRDKLREKYELRDEAKNSGETDGWEEGKLSPHTNSKLHQKSMQKPLTAVQTPVTYAIYLQQFL